MDDPSGVDIFKRQTDLNKPIEDLSFRKMFLFIHLSLDVVTEISNLAVLHYNYQLFESKVTLLVSDNMWMVQILQQINFEHGILLFSLLEPLQHDLLGNVLFLLGFVDHKVCRT